MIAGLPGVLEGRGLKNRHRDRAADQRLRLAGVNQLGVEPFDKSRHAASDATTFITRRVRENRYRRSSSLVCLGMASARAAPVRAEPVRAVQRRRVEASALCKKLVKPSPGGAIEFCIMIKLICPRWYSP